MSKGFVFFRRSVRWNSSYNKSHISSVAYCPRVTHLQETMQFNCFCGKTTCMAYAIQAGKRPSKSYPDYWLHWVTVLITSNVSLSSARFQFRLGTIHSVIHSVWQIYGVTNKTEDKTCLFWVRMPLGSLPHYPTGDSFHWRCRRSTTGNLELYETVHTIRKAPSEL